MTDLCARNTNLRLKAPVRALIGLIALLAAGACTQVPELDETIHDHLRDAPYPQLVRLDHALGAPVDPHEEAEEIEKALEARRQRLQARARQLMARPQE